MTAALSPAPIPGRYQASSGTAYQLAGDGRWHRVYTSGTVSRAVAPVGRHQRADLTEITANPAAAAMRAGRCPCCQAPCGEGFDPADCECASCVERRVS